MTLLAGGAGQSDHPPKPALALTIGVVGHLPKKLPADDKALAAIRSEVDRVLGMLVVAVYTAFGANQKVFAKQPPVLSVMCGLAEGADRIVALAVTERSARDFHLDVVLPFPPDEYKKDFKQPGSLAEFDKLRKAARAVLGLPGTRKSADDPDDLDAKKAYEATGLTILSQSDILVTIWNGGPSGGRGGTTEMLNTAARIGIPIVHIDATGTAAPYARWTELREHPVPVNAAEDLTGIPLDQQVLDRMVDKIVRPPKPESHSRGFVHRHYTMAAYFNERFRQFDIWFLYRFIYPSLLAVSFVRGFRRSETCPSAPQRLAEDLRRMVPTEPNNDKHEAREQIGASRSNRLINAYGWADSVGTRFALIFRSAFVVNFVVAALAVIVAAGSLVAIDLTEPHVFEHLVTHKTPYVITELVLIAIVLLNTISGWLGRWHPRWIESREIAERLRVALPLWVLGARPAVFPGEEPTWTGWYARAVIRAQGLRRVTFDGAALRAAGHTLLAVLNDQRGYHAQTAQRMSKLECRLEGAGVALFVFTFVAVAAFLGAHWGGWTVTPWETYLVTAIAAGLPALATALYGIRVIGDFDGFARRSQRMCGQLDDLIEALDADWPKENRETQPPNFALLRARARAAETAMLSDVQNWRLAAESRELTIPG